MLKNRGNIIRIALRGEGRGSRNSVSLVTSNGSTEYK